MLTQKQLDGVHSLSVLNGCELAALRSLQGEWEAARAKADYKKADMLRSELDAFGCLPPDYCRWHPVFESPSHRESRLVARGV